MAGADTFRQEAHTDRLARLEFLLRGGETGDDL